MNYKIIKGYRKSSNLLYTIDEHQLYYKCKLMQNGIYYVCRIKGCKAAVILQEEGCLSKNKTEHCHDSQEHIYEELNVLNKIKDECNLPISVASESVRQIFNKNCYL